MTRFHPPWRATDQLLCELTVGCVADFGMFSERRTRQKASIQQLPEPQIVFGFGQVLTGMARADTSDSDVERREIRLVEEEDGRWSATDEAAGVASQGETRSEALANLDEAVALHNGEIGDPVTDADLRDLGFDPDAVPDEPQKHDAPWFSE
jgi:hypothetical protein